MRKRRWVGLMLLVVVPGLLLAVSCAQKAVKSEPVMTESEVEIVAERAAEKALREETVKRQAIEEETLRVERARQVRAKAAAEESARRTARRAFLNEDIRFDFDSAVLLPMAEDLLRKKAEWMRKNPGVSATVEGHCDERGTNQYNLALGDRRAASAKTYLINLGIDAARLEAISYGEEQPVAAGHDEASWAKNRRAHFVLR